MKTPFAKHPCWVKQPGNVDQGPADHVPFGSWSEDWRATEPGSHEISWLRLREISKHEPVHTPVVEVESCSSLAWRTAMGNLRVMSHHYAVAGPKRKEIPRGCVHQDHDQEHASIAIGRSNLLVSDITFSEMNVLPAGRDVSFTVLFWRRTTATPWPTCSRLDVV